MTTTRPLKTIADTSAVKRALRALQSPAYEKARKKNPLLPEITDRASLENTFKLLPMSMLALRVNKVDPNAAHSHGKKPKRVKGLWTVKVEPQQDAADDMYYAWLYEGSQVMRKVYAALALLVVFTIVLYPLWPLKLRLGVYYLSWGFLGLLGLFFLMAIFRVILFCVTYFAVPPGLWLYPNLWEDVSFMDSFRPVWAWHEVGSSSSIHPSLEILVLTRARPSPRRRRRRRAPRPGWATRRRSRASAPRRATRRPRAPLRPRRRQRLIRSLGSGGTRRPRLRRRRTSEPECFFFRRWQTGKRVDGEKFPCQVSIFPPFFFLYLLIFNGVFEGC